MMLTANSAYIALLIGTLSCFANATDVPASGSSQQFKSPRERIAEGEMSNRERPPHKGDEWEYVSTDVFGKKQTLFARVLEPRSQDGVLEEFGVRRRTLQEFAFNNQPTVFFNGSDSIVWFSPYWNGKDIQETTVLNKDHCSTLQYVSGCAILRATRLGGEKITVPAGAFDTEKLQIEIDLQSQYGSGWLILTAWYSPQEQRIVRQTIKGNHSIQEGWPNTLNDNVELVAIRRAK